MKRNLKLLSAILLITLSSCQEENIFQENKPNSLKVKEITFSNAKEIKILDNTLTKVFEGIKSHNKNTAPVEDNDFTIDTTEKVKVMSDDNSTTYTMLIKRAIESPEYFENLVIKITENSQPKAYIFKYIPSEESHYVYIHNEYSFKGNFDVHEILYNSSVFQPLVNMSGCGLIALCDYGGTTHNAGENCTEVYYVAGNCDTTVPDSGGGSIPLYTAPVGSGPSGGGATLQGNVLKMNSFLTNLSFAKQDLFATFPQGAQDAIFNYFVTNTFSNDSKNKVSNFLQSIISNNLASYFTSDISATSIDSNLGNSTNSIINYLIQNNFTSQSLAFVNQLISSGITHSTVFTLDSTINSTNGMSFNTMADLNNYLNTPEPQTAPTSSITDSATQQNERTIIASKSVNILINFTAIINQSKIAPFAVKNVTSDYDGVWFGNSWTQSSYNVTPRGDNTTKIEIFGKRKFSIWLNGVGGFGSVTHHYQIIINTTTGQIITFFQIS